MPVRNNQTSHLLSNTYTQNSVCPGSQSTHKTRVTLTAGRPRPHRPQGAGGSRAGRGTVTGSRAGAGAGALRRRRTWLTARGSGTGSVCLMTETDSPVRIDWSMRSVVEKIFIRRRSAGILSPTTGGNSEIRHDIILDTILEVKHGGQ